MLCQKNQHGEIMQDMSRLCRCIQVFQDVEDLLPSTRAGICITVMLNNCQALHNSNAEQSYICAAMPACKRTMDFILICFRTAEVTTCGYPLPHYHETHTYHQKLSVTAKDVYC